MAITHGIVALNNSTAVALNTDASSTDSFTGERIYSYNSATFSVQNLDQSATVYLGGAEVSASSYGRSVPPLTTVEFQNLTRSQTLYAISTGSSSVAVLTIPQ
jgi:hypothetical protein